MNGSQGFEQRRATANRSRCAPRCGKIKHFAVSKWGRVSASTLHLVPNTITGDLVPDSSARQVFTRVNQTFILWGVAASAGDAAQHPHPWSPSNYLLHSDSRINFFGLYQWKSFEVHTVYMSTDVYSPPPLNYLWQRYWFSPIFVSL